MQRTRSTTFGPPAAARRVVTITSFEPVAVSAWPPDPPSMRPDVPVVTLTLKSRSTSAAPRIIASSWLTTAPRLWGLAYKDADMA